MKKYKKYRFFKKNLILKKTFGNFLEKKKALQENKIGIEDNEYKQNENLKLFSC